MPKRFMIYFAMALILGLGACAKRNTAYQEETWLSLVRQISLVGNALDMQIDNNYIYLAQDQGGISVIRRSDYNHQWLTKLNATDGSQTPLGRIKKIAVVPEHNRIFINEIAATDRITIINNTDPDTLLYIFDFIGGTGGIKDLQASTIPNASGPYTMNLGYSSAGGFRWELYDGNYLSTPSLTLAPPATASGFALTPELVLITAEQRGLFIYNRSTQQYISELALPGEAQKVVIKDNLALIPSRQAGLNIVNISDPASPILLSTSDTSGYATAVDISGNKVAVSSGSGGVYLYDISNPANPTLLERLTSCGYANKVLFMDDKLLVATRDQGLLLYKVK